ncbi:MAG: hypothetical protein F6K24_25655 [Okeania sp. SIO2D1]|nr:hypothetical protein [Okeania sp. SIO2D1]
MKLNVWKIVFLTGLILSLSSINKAVTVRSESVDIVAQFQDIARLAKLNPVQVEKLVDLDNKKIENSQLRVILPSYIPSEFRVDKVEVVNTDLEANYKIIYRNLNNFCFYLQNNISGKKAGQHYFLLETAKSRSGVETIYINSSVIGNAYLDIYNYGNISTNPSISLVSLQNIGFKFESPCSKNDQAITTSKAVKILESLQYLNP